MARLFLSLLGPLQIRLNDQSVSGFAYNKARALLAYLVVESDRPHHRDALVGLLWPELPDSAARTNLRQALANLREVIGDATATPPFLYITRDTIQFNAASDYTLDAHVFTALLAACEAHPHRHLERCRSCAARMEQALALYCGDFLAEFALSDSAPFEEWQLRHRERLHQQALDTLARLADYLERRGDDDHAARYAQRQIELDPWREEAYRQLMRLLARRGQRRAALSQYENCRRILARDLGVEPEAETTALYKRIRDSTGVELSAPKHATQGTTNMQNVPAPTTLLIGRETELVELGALLENPACRLITIVGPGGIGKTRLALAAATEQAESFADGAAFVPLAAVSSAAFLVPAIMGALAVPLQGQRDPHDQLVNYLHGKELLLVLDNFEQLLATDLSENESGATLLMDILQRASGVTLLVTSRERLALPGEWLFDVSGLSYPTGETVNGIEGYNAVQLFIQRASQMRRQFALDAAEMHAVARICRVVEGMPLAIELAASAVRGRSCAAIAAAIENSLSTLSAVLRAVPERHRSIWATFEHSWRLLSDAERQVLPRLSVFRGGFEQDSAVQVAQASPELLASLVDKSLLRCDGTVRYDMHELIRQYASEKLEQAGQVEQTRDDHLAHYLALAEAAEPQLAGTDQVVWMDRLETNHHNLRAALEWCKSDIDSDQRSEAWLRLAAALWLFWEMRGHIHEGLAWLSEALARVNNAETPSRVSSRAPICFGTSRRSPSRIHAAASAQAQALIGIGHLARRHGDYSRAAAVAEQSLSLCRELADQWGYAASLHMLGRAVRDQGDYARAAPLLEECLSLYRQLADKQAIAYATCTLAILVKRQGNYQRAIALNEEGLALFREAKDQRGSAAALQNLAGIMQAQGDYDKAAHLFQQSLASFKACEDKPCSADVLASLGAVAQLQGDYKAARAFYEASLALKHEIGNMQDVANLLSRLEMMAHVPSKV